MSDTPRTHSQLLTVKYSSYAAPHPAGEYVHADFARQLERDNAELRKLLREAITSLARYRAALGKEDQP
jgi:hypothetical protein